MEGKDWGDQGAKGRAREGRNRIGKEGRERIGQGGKEGARAEREGQDGAREGRKVSESEVKGMSASAILTTKLIIAFIITL